MQNQPPARESAKPHAFWHPVNAPLVLILDILVFAYVAMHSAGLLR